MNLPILFEAQKVLNERIVKEKGLEGCDLFPEKILALLTELGELSNEWCGFKFWSEDRDPRTFKVIPIEVIDGATPKGFHSVNPLLEEYVDCLHFILSLGLEIHPAIAHMSWTNNSIGIVESLTSKNEHVSVTDMFNNLFKRVIVFYETYELSDYAKLFYLFWTLGRKLNFTLTDIEYAYHAKNKINHSRQNNGY